MWQFHLSSKNWKWSKSFRSWEREMFTSSFHLNWKCSPVLFIWTGNVDQFISSELEMVTRSFFWTEHDDLFIRAELNVLTGSFELIGRFLKLYFIQLEVLIRSSHLQFSSNELVNAFSSKKWTGHYLQLKWNELINISSLDERNW